MKEILIFGAGIIVGLFTFWTILAVVGLQLKKHKAVVEQPKRSHLKKGKDNKEDIEKVRTLLSMGFQQREIAQKMGVAQSTISHFIKRNNLKQYTR